MNCAKELIFKVNFYAEKYKELLGITSEKTFLKVFGETSKILKQAADTIESLSEKLQAADMERSAEDCSGWISCKERLPEENEFVLVSVQLSENSFKEYETCCGYLMNGKWYTYTERDFFEVGEMHRTDKVVAWQLLPEPYHDS